MSYGNYVNSTLQQAGGDLARGTKYRAIISLPETFQVDYQREFPSKFDVLLKSINIPEVTNEVTNVQWKGHDIPIPTRTKFNQTFTCSFYLDEKHILRNVLDIWIRAIDPYVLGGNSSYLEYDKNSGFMKIEALNFEEGSITHFYEFFYVKPISIEGLQFDSNAPSTIQEVQVTFSYVYYTIRHGNKSLSNIFEDTKNNMVNSIFNSVFGDSDIGKIIRSTTPGIKDIFKSGGR
jgi:hypothetical protein